jgi:hypothetical protein
MFLWTYTIGIHTPKPSTKTWQLDALSLFFRCGRCVLTQWPCHWCIYDNLCTHNSSHCSADFIYSINVSFTFMTSFCMLFMDILLFWLTCEPYVITERPSSSVSVNVCLGRLIRFFWGLLGVITGRFLSMISSAAHPRWPLPPPSWTWFLSIISQMPWSTGPIFLWLIGCDWRKVPFDDPHRRSFYVIYTYLRSIFASTLPFGLPEEKFA